MPKFYRGRRIDPDFNPERPDFKPERPISTQRE